MSKENEDGQGGADDPANKWDPKWAPQNGPHGRFTDFGRMCHLLLETTGFGQYLRQKFGRLREAELEQVAKTINSDDRRPLLALEPPRPKTRPKIGSKKEIRRRFDAFAESSKRRY